MAVRELPMVLVALSTATLASAQPAPATDELELKKECVAQYELAQSSTRNARLVEARKALLMCSQDGCPALVRTECVELLDGVERNVPSVVFSARWGAEDVVDVRVLVDGNPIASRLDGAAVELNPGVHTFRFERPGSEPYEQVVLIAEGEKNRVIAATFAKPEPPPGAAGNTSRAPADSPATPAEEYRPIPTLTYVFGGVALAGVGGFVAFGLWGLDQERSLESTCQPFCTDAEVAPVREKLIIADVSLGIAIASSIVATVIYVNRPAVPRPARSGLARPRPRFTVRTGVGPTQASVMLRGEL
jgi:hypothetical protein